MSNFAKDLVPVLPETKVATRMLNAAEQRKNTILTDDINDGLQRDVDLRNEVRGLRVDPRHYGALADGATDDTAAWALALAAAATHPSRTMLVPRGISVLSASPTRAGALAIPAGVALAGEGYDSAIRVNAASVNADGGFYLLTYGSNCQLSAFRIDGNRGAINRAGRASVQFFAVINTASGATNVTCENLHLHDIIGIGQESFGLMTGAGCSGIHFRRCRGWNVEGTPFHLNGDIALAGDWTQGNLISDSSVEDCEAWDNTWQGVSLYGAKRCQVSGGTFYRNTTHGVNCEWCFDVDVKGATAHNNGLGGFGSYGKASYRLLGCASYDNNTLADATGAEVRLRPGAWYTGSPAPRGNAGAVEVRGCSVRPRAGSRHLYFDRDTGVNVGITTPERVTLAQPDAPTWTVGSSTAGHIYPRVEMQGVEVSGPVLLGRLLDFAPAGAALAAYASTGATAAGATTLTAAAQFGEAHSGYVLRAGRRYRLRMRVRMEDAVSAWGVFAQDLGGAKTGFTRFMPVVAEVGAWQEQDICLAPSADSRVQVMRMDAGGGSSAFSVDFLTAEELATPAAQSDALPFAGRLMDSGSAAPLSGTWPARWIRWNDAPAAGGKMGWVCVTAGTPGTWKAFGAIDP